MTGDRIGADDGPTPAESRASARPQAPRIEDARAAPEVLTRKTDWPMLLNSYVIDAQARYAETGLKWGEFDCVTFACDWALAATGNDPMADYRGKYASAEEAARLLRDKGPGTLLAALRAHFGHEIAPALARRGDIAFRKADKTCGIVIAQGARMRALFLGEEGLMQLPALAVDLAFRV